MAGGGKTTYSANYLKNNNWTRREHLTLGEMVDDIINVSDKDLIDYKIKNNNRMG